MNSEEGIGTTVLITLPCIEQKKEPDNHETVNVELISSGFTLRKGLISMSSKKCGESCEQFKSKNRRTGSY